MNSPQPVNRRIVGFDIARALAVFGMVIVNFKVAMGAEHNGPAWLVGTLGLLDGRAAALFVVLAGVGISLLTKAGIQGGDVERLSANRKMLLKRALFLFVVGLAYTPIWPADILHFYGVYIAVAALLLAASTRRLWTIAGGLVLAFPVLFVLVDYEQGWDWNTLEYAGMWTPVGFVCNLFYNGFHPVIPWLAFLLVGMVLGRQDLRDSQVRRRVFFWGAGVALATELASRLLVGGFSAGATAEDQEVIAFLLGSGPMPPLPFYMAAGTGTACAVIAVCVGIGERFGDRTWLRPLIATGQLALTLYVAHVVIGMGFLESFGWLDDQTLSFSFQSAIVFCIGGTAFAGLWRWRFKRGPLEAVMRKVAG